MSALAKLPPLRADAESLPAGYLSRASLVVGTLAHAYGHETGVFPAPLPLPGTAGGASGPCYALADVPYAVPGTLPSTGRLTFRVPVPLRPSFHGVRVYGQAVAIDAAANALGVVTSNGINHQVVAPYGAQPGGRVYRSGSLAATGTVGRGQTFVVQISHP